MKVVDENLADLIGRSEVSLYRTNLCLYTATIILLDQS